MRAYLADLCRADMERVAMHSLATEGPVAVALDVSSSGRSPSARAVAADLSAIAMDGSFPATLAAGRLEACGPGKDGVPPAPVPPGESGMAMVRPPLPLAHC